MSPSPASAMVAVIQIFNCTIWGALAMAVTAGIGALIGKAV